MSYRTFLFIGIRIPYNIANMANTMSQHPKACLLPLEAMATNVEDLRMRRLAALTLATAVRDMIREEIQGQLLHDSADLLCELRESRIDDLSGVPCSAS